MEKPDQVSTTPPPPASEGVSVAGFQIEVDDSIPADEIHLRSVVDGELRVDKIVGVGPPEPVVNWPRKLYVASEALTRVLTGRRGDMAVIAADPIKGEEALVPLADAELVIRALRRGDAPAPSEDPAGEVEVEPVAVVESLHSLSNRRMVRARTGADLPLGSKVYSHETVQRLQRRINNREGRLEEARVEIARLQTEKDEAREKGHEEGLREADLHIGVLERRIAHLQEERDRLQRERDGEVWLWQGDGSDEPDSLSCPVLMHPDDLRALLAQIGQADDVITARDREISRLDGVLERAYRKIARLRDPASWRVELGNKAVGYGGQVLYHDFMRPADCGEAFVAQVAAKAVLEAARVHLTVRYVGPDHESPSVSGNAGSDAPVSGEVEVGSFGGMSGYVLLPGDCEWEPGTPVRITRIGPPESEGESDE